MKHVITGLALLMAVEALAEDVDRQRAAVVVITDGGLEAERPVWARRMRVAIRKGVSSVGAQLCDERLENEAITAAFRGTECDDACVAVAKRLLSSCKVLIVRLSVASDLFVANLDSRLSAAGELSQVEAAGEQLGRAAASNQAFLHVKDDPSVQWFVDGVPIRIGGTATPVKPGRHVIRRGDGMGPRALRIVTLAPGETYTIVHALQFAHASIPMSDRHVLTQVPPKRAKRAKWIAGGIGAAVLVSLGIVAATYTTDGRTSTKTVIEIGEQ